MKIAGISGLFMGAVLVAGCSEVDDPSLFPAYDPAEAVPPHVNPALPANPERNLYWGDVHIHTSLSTDAYMMGVRASPDDAYTFAKGGEIEHGLGYGIRIKRPLDFAGVTDHAEYLGIMKSQDPEVPIKSRSLRERFLHDGPLKNTAMILYSLRNFTLEVDEGDQAAKVSRSAWQEIIDTAERHNDPGRFTTFIGYEWTSMPNNRNLHRNIIYRSAKVPEFPFSSLDSENPQDLWDALDAQRNAGMDSIAITHNGNLSDGYMYDSVTFDGKPIDATYAEQRMRNEPIAEMFQIKGSSETHPLLSVDDEFADFELYENLISAGVEITKARPKGGYIRDALRKGMEFAHSEGFNPYRFGVVGSTDSHNASSPTEEDNYSGKLPMLDGSAGIRLGESVLFPEEYLYGKQWSAAGLAAVWAEENTRASLFDAMRRKETYATSGPRIRVRFFGGWGYPNDLLQSDRRIELAQATGVPMGGVLSKASAAAPDFVVWAVKDPESGNLDRIQIVKAWIAKDGTSREKVYDVALASHGSSVSANKETDQARAAGVPQLWAQWNDPDFDSTAEAFYYARVLEVPTPRWSTYDAEKLGLDPPEPTLIRERAVTSAIWYQPDSRF